MRSDLLSKTSRLLSRNTVSAYIRTYQTGYQNGNRRYGSEDPFGGPADYRGRRSAESEGSYSDVRRQGQGMSRMNRGDDGDWGYSQNNRYGGSNIRRGGFGGGRDNRSSFRRKSFQGGNSAEDDIILSRNVRRDRGEVDDGLLGEEDYPVDYEAIKEFDWKTLLEEIPEGHEKVPGFSGVPVSALAKHQLLSRALVNSLIYNKKYDQLTDVQLRSIFPILQGDSVMVRAKTGTGKTAAFAIPVIQQVLKAKEEGADGVKALILTPTRELAQQIGDEIFSICKYSKLNDVTVQCLVGGLSKSAQIRNAFQGRQPVDIIVATPGRLADIFENDGYVLDFFGNLKFKILDEADRLLDAGFEKELFFIRETIDEASARGKDVPTCLFSATVDSRMREFAKNEFGSKARIIDTVPENEPEAQELVEQSIVNCEGWNEIYAGVLQGIVEESQALQSAGKDFKAIVFLPTSKLVDHYYSVMQRYFENSKLRISAVHGKMTQSARQRAADRFKDSRQSIIVATDVIARGMDFPMVSHVFQMGSTGDVPQYIHRIGRTARVGNSGKSILFIDSGEEKFLSDLKSANITNFALSEFEKHEDFDEEVFTRATALSDPAEANELYNNMLAGVGRNRKVLQIDRSSFLARQKGFARLLGLNDPRLDRSQYELWVKGNEPNYSRRTSFGGGRFGGRGRY